MTPEVIRHLTHVYFEDLAELSLADVLELFQLARQESRFFPTIFDLRQLAGLAPALAPREALKRRAELAWAELFQPTDGRPYNRAVLDKDPLTRQVFMAMGGGSILEWGFGRWNKDQDPWKRREFTNLFMQAGDPNWHLSHDDAQRFLRDNGLDHLLGGMPGTTPED